MSAARLYLPLQLWHRKGQLKPGVGPAQFVSQHSMTGSVNPRVLYC